MDKTKENNDIQTLKNKSKRLEKAKGITLIALVITIIVLLILAAVSIATLTGKNGILLKAQDAVTKDRQSQTKEIVELAWIASQLKKDIQGENDLTDTLKKEVENQLPDDDVKVFNLGNNSYEVDIEGKGNYIVSDNGDIVEQENENYAQINGAGFYRNTGEFISWEDLIKKELIIVQDNTIKDDADRAYNGTNSTEAKDWEGILVVDNSITKIEYYSMNNLPGITKIIIPDSVNSIDPDFNSVIYYVVDNVRYKSKLRNIEVDINNSTYISKDGALFTKDMKTLVRVPPATSGTYIVPTGVNKIERYAFRDSSVSNVIIPNTVTTINNFAFADCMNLTELNLPNSVNSIEYNGMTYGSTNMININIEDGSTAYKSIDGVIFTKDLKKIIEFPKGRRGTYTIPNGVTTIGQYAFNTSLIDNVIMPETLTTIMPAGFAAPNFHSVVLPSSIRKISSFAFAKYGCEEITYNGIKYTSINEITTVLKNNGVTVDEMAFAGSALAN